MAANIHYGKNSTEGLCFYCLGLGRWVAESKESTSDVHEWAIWVSPLSAAMSLLCGFQCCWEDRPSQRQPVMQTLPIFFTPRYEILSGVLTIALCTSAGIWQLLKYRAEVGRQTNGGLGEYREVGLKQMGYTFAWRNWSQLPAEVFR